MCPKLTAARKRQLHHNPALPQWHFMVVFCQFRQKPGFFMQNVSRKGLQRPFWLSLHYVAQLARFWAASYSFLQLLWLILRALALVPRKVLKNAKNRVFATFALKIALFSLKTGEKAHTELQQRKTSLTKQFHVKNSVFSKISPTMSHLSDTSGHRGYIFTTLFLHIQTR